MTTTDASVIVSDGMTATAENQDEMRVSLRAPADQFEAIAKLASKHQRSLSGEIRMAIDAWIERCAKEEGTT